MPGSMEEGSTAECPGEEDGALKIAQKSVSRSNGGGSTAECPGAWEEHYRVSRITEGGSTTECPGALGKGALHECSGGQVGKALQSTQEQGEGAINNMSWLS